MGRPAPIPSDPARSCSAPCRLPSPPRQYDLSVVDPYFTLSKVDSIISGQVLTRAYSPLPFVLSFCIRVCPGGCIVISHAPLRQARGGRCAARGSLLCTTWTNRTVRVSGQTKQGGVRIKSANRPEMGQNSTGVDIVASGGLKRLPPAALNCARPINLGLVHRAFL